MDAWQVLTTTRSVRKRLDLERPVPRALVEECVEAALQAPSGGNRRGYRFVLVDDPEVRARLGEIYRRAFEEYRSGPGVATKAFPDRPDKDAQQRRVFDSAEHLATVLDRVPCLAIPCAERRLPPDAGHHAQASYWGSLLPAVWSFMLAARDRGLGTAWTTMHLRFESEAADVLGLDHERTAQLALTPVAFTRGQDFRPASHDSVGSYVSWA